MKQNLTPDPQTCKQSKCICTVRREETDERIDARSASFPWQKEVVCSFDCMKLQPIYLFPMELFPRPGSPKHPTDTFSFLTASSVLVNLSSKVVSRLPKMLSVCWYSSAVCSPSLITNGLTPGAPSLPLLCQKAKEGNVTRFERICRALILTA